MSRPLPREDSTPWYRQFWPWFLILLPATMVVAALATVYVALDGADDLVDDEYYRDGLGINRELAQLDRARERGITASLRIQGESIRVLTHGPVAAAQLRLRLAHPMEADRDFQLLLLESVPGEYHGRLAAAVAPRWHWILEPAAGDGWRLDGSLSAADFAAGSGG